MFNDFFISIKEVLSRKFYFFLFLIISFLFYSTNVLIEGYVKINSFKSIFFALWNFKNYVEGYTFYSVIILSILLGLFFSFLTYRAKELKLNSSKKTGFIGTLFALFVPGCAACGVGLVAIFGGSFASFLFLLPLHGLEISLIAISFLFYSIFKLSKEISNGGACQIDQMKMKGGRLMEKKKETYLKYGFFVLIGIAILFAVYSFGFNNSYVAKNTQQDTNSKYSASQNAEIQKFSECIADAGFEAFTADWCPHCENLKEYFGGDDNVEPFWVVCQNINRGQTKDSQRCAEEGIQGFPTLKLNGQELQIARTFEAISQATGCPAPNI